jgi:hypothetical protein
LGLKSQPKIWFGAHLYHLLNLEVKGHIGPKTKPAQIAQAIKVALWAVQPHANEPAEWAGMRHSEGLLKNHPRVLKQGKPPGLGTKTPGMIDKVNEQPFVKAAQLRPIGSLKCCA